MSSELSAKNVLHERF